MCTRLWQELDSKEKLRCSEQREIALIVSPAQMLADLVGCSCFGGLQPFLTDRMGPAARRKA